jgi:hypothetical protein
MPLILAIEPDKRQGSQLATVIKGLHAELVHRATAADALEALHGRVPDLVLTTSLISPRDDAALAAHLRELGAAAAHVQTVTIPVLGTAAPQRAKGGMLAALRREKPQASVTDGCAPEVFAEQVRQYLATAEEQKASVSSRIAVEPDVVEAPLAEPELVAAEAEFVAPEPIAFEAATTEVAPVVDDVPEPVTIEAAIVEAPMVSAPLEEDVELAEPDEFIADEPAGLPLSQLLQLVSDAAPAVKAPVVDATVFEAPVVEEFFTAPAAEPVAESVVAEPAAELLAEPVPAVADEWKAEEAWAPEPAPDPAPEPEAVMEPQLEPRAAGTFGDLYVDPMAAQALDELSQQAPMSSVVEGIPGEPPVPVVEMHGFQSLDSIASELAAAPVQRHESLDDIASLFAASPTAAQNETSPFASLFAQPAAPTAKPLDVPGIDPSLFASAPAISSTIFDEPLPIEVPGIDPGLFAPTPAMSSTAFDEPEPIVAYEPVHEPEPEVMAAPAPEPLVANEPEPIVAASPELVLAPLAEVPVVDELLVDDLFIDDPALPEPVVAAAAEPAFEDIAQPVVACEPVAFEAPVEAPAFEPEPEIEPAFEPEPVALAAAPDFDEEISLDVDAFTFTPPEPAPPAEPERFAFTLVDGFGDAWSDFEVPSIAAVAADLGLGDTPPLDPFAVTPAPAPAARRESSTEPAGVPSLDDEALSLIGDAARKLGLDALVIEEFERGMSAPKQKKVKKKVQVAAPPVPAAAAPAAKPTRRPVQDEWGMFDPEQCGFAALDEEEKETRPTGGTRVRVISY